MVVRGRGSRGAGERGSRGAGEQGSRGAGEQGSRGAGEQGGEPYLKSWLGVLAFQGKMP
ncbi:hypothetical protein JYQ62_35695 [Nostoc sp. UHCC 0702]|nr:hypothetical protein JYQ62_35695 [Nostoc sp. UHCC 0702]